MSKSKKDEGTEGMMIDAADWQARATHIRQVLAGAPDTAVAEALGTFLFADDDGKTWTYNGAAWMSWDGTQWSEGKVPSEVSMQPFLHDAGAAEADDAGAAVIAAAAEIATADSAKTGSAAMMAETPEAAKAETLAAEAKPVETPVSKEAILASVAASDATKADEADPSKSEAAAVYYPQAEKPAEEKPAEPAVVAAAVSAAARPEDTTATTAMPSDLASQPTGTDAGMAAGAGMAGAAGMTTSAGMASSSTAPAGSAPAATAGGMAMGQPAAATAAVGAAAVPASSPAASTPGAFRATHTVPSPGMGAWTKPDPSVRPEYQLAPRTELMVVEMTSSGWARVAGSNGWTGWVDGRQLQAIGAAAPQPQPVAAQPAWQQPAQQPAQTWQQPAQTSWQPAQPAQPAQTSWQQPAQPVPAQQPPAQPQAQQGGFRPTHAVPPMGMPAWAQPNPALPPQAQLGAGTQLMVAEWSQSGWARVVAANGWSGWVDGRMLVAFGPR